MHMASKPSLDKSTLPKFVGQTFLRCKKLHKWTPLWLRKTMVKKGNILSTKNKNANPAEGGATSETCSE